MNRRTLRDDRATVQRAERFFRSFADWLRRPSVWADPGVRFAIVTDPRATAPLWSWREARLTAEGWRVTSCRLPSAEALRAALAPAYRAEGLRLRQRYIIERARWRRVMARFELLAAERGQANG